MNEVQIINDRDLYVAMLRLCIKGWQQKQSELSPGDSQGHIRLQILIRKTNIFLQDEFGEKENV